MLVSHHPPPNEYPHTKGGSDPGVAAWLGRRRVPTCLRAGTETHCGVDQPGRPCPALPRKWGLLCGSIAGANESLGLRLVIFVPLLIAKYTHELKISLETCLVALLFNKCRLQPATLIFTVTAPCNYCSMYLFLCVSHCLSLHLQVPRQEGVLQQPVRFWELEVPHNAPRAQ